MVAIRIVHRVISALLTIVGLLLISFFAVKALNSVPGAVEVDYGWGEIGSEVVEANKPADYREFEYSGVVDSALDPSILDSFAGDNGFVVSTGLQMLIGLLGLGMMYSALAQRRTGRWALLHLGGVAGVVILGFYAFGFNFAYPGDFSMGGLLPAWVPGPFVALPEDNLFNYGMAFTIWTDFFYQSLYAVLTGAVVLSLATGRFRSPTVMLVAVIIGVLAFPLTTSWLWGGGWLSSLEAVDFAGSGMIHVLAGGAALALVVLGRLCPPAGPGFSPSPGARPREWSAPRMSPVSAIVFALGALIFALLIVGVNAGSVLASDAPVVAAVLNATACAVGGGVLAAFVLSLGLARRSRLLIGVAGGLAGWAAICAPADAVSSWQAFGIGSTAGGLGTCVLWLLDRYGFDDPFGVIGISFLGGSIGMVSAGIFSSDANVIVQILATVSIASVGFGVGGCLGLFAWLAKVLCEPPEMEAPKVD